MARSPLFVCLLPRGCSSKRETAHSIVSYDTFFIFSGDNQERSLIVHLTPKYFFRSNKYLHLFKTHCAFLPLFNLNLDFLQAVIVTKSGHHLLHDRASKGYGSIPGLRLQTSLHARFQRLNTMQISLWHQTRNRPMPLTSSIV